MSWINRKHEAIANEKAYFFGKHLALLEEQCKALINTEITTFEEKMGIHHEEAFMKFCRVSVAPDPLFFHLFIQDTAFSLDDFFEYYEKNAIDFAKGVPFVDLALLLGKIDHAKKFAQSQGLQYDILKISDECNDSRNFAEEMLRYKTSCNFNTISNGNVNEEVREACKLTCFVCDMFSSEAGKEYALTEMWRQGYEWDVYILSVILGFSASNSKFYKFVQTSFIKKHKDIAILGLMSDVLKHKVPFWKYASHSILVSVGPIVSYRLLIYACLKHEQSETDMEKKISERIKISRVFQEILLICLSSGKYDIFHAILNDFFRTIHNIDSSILSDMFYGADKVSFKRGVEFLASVYELVNHLTRRYRSSKCDEFSTFSKGVLGGFVKLWLKSGYYVKDYEKTCLESLKRILKELYSISKAENMKDALLTIGILNAILSSTQCNIFNDIRSLVVTDEIAHQITNTLKSNFTNSSGEDDLDIICKDLNNILFSESSTVKSVFEELNSGVVYTVENNNLNLLDYFEKHHLTFVSLESENTIGENLKDSSKPIESATCNLAATTTSSSGRGSSSSIEYISDSSNRSIKSSESKFKSGGFEINCMTEGFNGWLRT